MFLLSRCLFLKYGHTRDEFGSETNVQGIGMLRLVNRMIYFGGALFFQPFFLILLMSLTGMVGRCCCFLHQAPSMQVSSREKWVKIQVNN
jgi:hypothetical protein